MKTNMNGIEREMTPAEQAAYEQAAAVLAQEIAAEQAAEQERIKTRQNALTKLGLTADEIAALFG